MLLNVTQGVNYLFIKTLILEQPLALPMSDNYKAILVILIVVVLLSTLIVRFSGPQDFH